MSAGDPPARGPAPVALTGGVWLLAKLLRYAFPALFPTFRGELSVPNAWLGGAFTAMMLLYSLMQFPSGAAADRLDDVGVLVAGAVTAAAGSLLLVLPVSFPVLVAGMLLVGLGTGVHKTVSLGVLARCYPDRTGRAIGVFDTLGTFGGVAAPAAVVVALSTGDWRGLFVAGGVAGLGLAALLATRVPRRPSPAAGRPALSLPDRRALRPYVAPFRQRRFQLFVGATLFGAFAYNGAVAFLPLYLVEAGVEGTTASAIYGAVFAASVVQVATGSLSDRLGRPALSAVVLGLAGVSLLGLVAAAGAGALALGVAAVGFGLGSHGFRPVRGAYLSTEIPDEVAGGGLGLVRTLLMGVGSLAPAAVGLTADVASFRAAFALLAAAMGVAAVLAVVTALLARGD